MEKKKIYQVVCVYGQDTESYSEESEFVLGTYISEKRALEVKDEVERQAIEDNGVMPLEYKINEFVILDWEEYANKN